MMIFPFVMASAIGLVQASVFCNTKVSQTPQWENSWLTCPSMFMEQLPHIPSRQDLLNERVGSISFFILMSASRTMGEHSLTLMLYVWSRCSGRSQCAFMSITCGFVAIKPHLSVGFVSGVPRPTVDLNTDFCIDCCAFSECC